MKSILFVLIYILKINTGTIIGMNATVVKFSIKERIYVKYILILLLSLFSLNCYLSVLPKETKKIIPPDANKVILTFDMPKDSLFLLISEFLSNNNYRIYNFDKDIGFINTDSHFISMNMNLRLYMMISPNGEHSKLSCKGEWNLESTNEQNRIWRAADASLGTFWKRGYENMVLEIQKLPYKEIQYIRE